MVDYTLIYIDIYYYSLSFTTTHTMNVYVVYYIST